MRIDDAIQAHASWKLRLSAYLRKPDGSIDLAALRLDDRCELGRWLKANGSTLGRSEVYLPLLREHARFHQAAAEVVRRANAGENVSEDIALGSRSDFGAASAAVVAHLMKLKRQLGG